MKKRYALLAATAMALTLLAPAGAWDSEADVALVIAIDISASVSPAEYRQQMAGLAAALRSPEVRQAIRSGKHQKAALAVMQWSGVRAQYLTLPWTVLASGADIEAFATRVERAPRAEDGGATSISAAIQQAVNLMTAAPPAARRVIDVSADGISNIGPSLEAARALALDAGITINGLAVTNEWRELRAYLEENVIAGDHAFAVEARNYADYGDVMLRKLVRELQLPGAV